MESIEQINKGKRYSCEEMLKHPSLKKMEGVYKRTRWPGVFSYTGTNGTKFGIDYYVNGKQKREMIGSLQEARDKLAEIHAQINKGEFVVNRKKFTFDQLKEKYEEIYKGEPYFENSRKYYLKILQGHFGGMKLYQIGPFDIEEFKVKRKATLTQHGKERSGVSVNREMETFRHMLNKGCEWQMLERNPFDRFKKKSSIFFPEDRGRVRYLTEDEIRRLVAVCPPYLANIVMAAILSGLRKGDLLGLEWEDVDLEIGLITYSEQKKRGRKVTKALCSDMICLLQTIPRGKSPFIFNGPIPQKKGEKNYVAYPDPDGKPLKDCQRSFRSALKRAGISDFRFHDLRHCSGSLLAQKGVSLQVIQEHLGHSDISMTMRYSHLSDAAVREGIDKLNGLFGEASA